jgi:hypothetical protein
LTLSKHGSDGLSWKNIKYIASANNIIPNTTKNITPEVVNQPIL